MKIPMARLRGFQGIYTKVLNRELPNLEDTRKASSSGGRGKSMKKVAKDFLFS